MFLIFAVTAYIGVFGTGLLAGFLFQFLVQDPSFSSKLYDSASIKKLSSIGSIEEVAKLSARLVYIVDDDN